MSTHSYIGVIEEDGTLKYVYCHSDGYPSYLGRMLLTYYNTPELATGLVNLGDLSMVRSMVRKRLVPDKGEYHTFKKPVREGPKGGITTAYHRDRHHHRALRHSCSRLRSDCRCWLGGLQRDHYPADDHRLQRGAEPSRPARRHSAHREQPRRRTVQGPYRHLHPQ